MPATKKKAVAKATAAKPAKKPAAKKIAVKKPTISKSPTVGSSAPACNLNLTGNKTVDLASFKGKKNVVLYFYPKDDTPGCTIEANDFAKLNAQFEKADTIVIGISKDDLKSHDKFRAKYDLPFALASDNSGITEAFGAWGEKNMYGKTYMGIVRSTFLIDMTGKIAHSWPKVSVTGHAMEVLKAASEAGALIIVVLHDLSIAARHATRVLLLSDGHVSADGEPAATLSSEQLRKTFGIDAFIGDHAGAPVILPLKRRA